MSEPAFSRRSLLVGGAAAAAWVSLGRVPATAAETPSQFPAGVPLGREAFENWCGEIQLDDVWTCAPSSAADILAVANWAAGAGWTLRPRGRMHAWAPLVLGDSDVAGQVMLLDTGRLSAISVAPETRTVRMQAGAQLTDVLTALKGHGLGLGGFPAIGEISIAGALAIGAHGAGVWSGSLSDRVVDLSAVVWSARLNRFVVRRFARSDPAIAPLLVSLGRVPVTEVTLRATPDQKLRCVSRLDIPASELYAPPARAGSRSFTALLARTGAVDAVWFPFTAKPWVKTWQPVASRPLLSRPVSSPYNYPFTDRIPAPVADLAEQLVTGNAAATPLFGKAMYDVVLAGLTATATWDITGAARDVCLWTRASSLPSNDFGFVVLCRRDGLQAVVSQLHERFVGLRDAYRARGEYPVNMPLHVRVSGVDRADAGLSPIAARPDRPDWDTAVWVNVLTLVGTESSPRFLAELQSWALDAFDGANSAVRFEWSKGWAYTDAGSWSDSSVLDGQIPASYSVGRPPALRWPRLASALQAYDPQGVFATPFHNRLLN